MMDENSTPLRFCVSTDCLFLFFSDASYLSFWALAMSSPGWDLGIRGMDLLFRLCVSAFLIFVVTCRIGVGFDFE